MNSVCLIPFLWTEKRQVERELFHNPPYAYRYNFEPRMALYISEIDLKWLRAGDPKTREDICKIMRQNPGEYPRGRYQLRINQGGRRGLQPICDIQI